MYYDIIWVQGHIEVYDNAGRFCFSADSEGEALGRIGGNRLRAARPNAGRPSFSLQCAAGRGIIDLSMETRGRNAYVV